MMTGQEFSRQNLNNIPPGSLVKSTSSSESTATKLSWLACAPGPASSLECVMLLAVARRPGNLAQQA